VEAVEAVEAVQVVQVEAMAASGAGAGRRYQTDWRSSSRGSRIQTC